MGGGQVSWEPMGCASDHTLSRTHTRIACWLVSWRMLMVPLNERLERRNAPATHGPPSPPHMNVSITKGTSASRWARLRPVARGKRPQPRQAVRVLRRSFLVYSRSSRREGTDVRRRRRRRRRRRLPEGRSVISPMRAREAAGRRGTRAWWYTADSTPRALSLSFFASHPSSNHWAWPPTHHDRPYIYLHIGRFAGPRGWHHVSG